MDNNSDHPLPTGHSEDEETLGEAALMPPARRQISIPADPDAIAAFSRCAMDQFSETGDMRCINDAIAFGRLAVGLTPFPDEEYSTRLAFLGASLLTRFKRNGDSSDLEEAIKTLKLALDSPSIDEDPAQLSSMQTNLASCLKSRGERTRDVSDITTAISLYVTAIRLAIEESDATRTNHATMVELLATALIALFELTEDLEVLDTAISVYQNSIDLTANVDRAQLGQRFARLGLSFRARFQCTGDLPSLQSATKALWKAIDLTPQNDAAMPANLTSLATILHDRGRRTGKVSDVKESVSLHQKALQLAQESGNEIPPAIPVNLANSLLQLFKFTRDSAPLEQAISLLESTMKTVKAGNDQSFLPSLLSILGNCYDIRYKKIGKAYDRVEYIQLRRDVVRMTTPGTPAHTEAAINLATSLGDQSSQTGNLSGIEESIAFLQMAEGRLPEGHINRPLCLEALERSFSQRYDRTGDKSDLGKAILSQRQAIDITPEGHPNLPAMLFNCAKALLARFEDGLHPSDLFEALHLMDTGILQTPDEDPNLGLYFVTRGNALYTLFQASNDLDPLANCIKFLRRGHELLAADGADLCAVLVSLGSALMASSRHSGSLSEIAEAISLVEKAVELAPEAPLEFARMLGILGKALLLRNKLGGAVDAASIAEPISLAKWAIDLTPLDHPSLPQRWVNLGHTYMSRFFSPFRDPEDLSSATRSFRSAATCPYALPDDKVKGATYWARSLQVSGSPNPATILEAYDTALRLSASIPRLNQPVVLRFCKVQDISGFVAPEAAGAALTYQRPDKALEWLEQGRCFIWSQLTNLRTPLDELKDCYPELALEVCKVAKELETISTKRLVSTVRMSSMEKVEVEVEASRHLALTEEWEQLLGKVRVLPDFETFLSLSPCSALLKDLPSSGYVVVINLNEERCDAIALAAGMDGPLHIPLPNFGSEKANQHREQLRYSLESFQLRMRQEGAHGGDEEKDRGLRRAGGVQKSKLQMVLKGLWKDVVKPIVTALKLSKVDSNSEVPSRIWWCPTGALSFLPIHAAGIYDKGKCEGLVDYAVSSYIPTVTSLIHRVKNSRPIQKELAGLLLTSQPAAPRTPRISGTTKEVQAIYEAAVKQNTRASQFDGDDTSPEGFMKLMEDFSCVHLACHASQNAEDPLESRFLFHKGPLDLQTIIQRDLKNADLAFLSACQTSAGEEKLPNEAVHLAAGMLAAGYRRVVATMWSIRDEYAPDVAKDFYGYLWEKGEQGEGFDGRLSGEALHYAVGRLRGRLGDTEQDLLAWIPYVHFGY